jgi:aryl-alcohol dehydrogenase-like predicted oxidoreductase
MEYRQLGLTGIEVSRIALGCGNFGGIGSAPAFFGQGESRDEAFALMDAARGRGITLFDTADAYGGGRSETWIGEWIVERGWRPVVTTKVFHSVQGDPSDRGLAPRRIRRQLAGSLERLGVERVDVYLTHESDPETPLEDTLATLAELVREGSVRAIGLSNATAEELEQALSVAQVSCVQNSYSLLDQSAAGVLDLCAEHGVAFTAFSPLAGGWLTGKYRRGEPAPPGSRMALRPEAQEHLAREQTFAGLDALTAAAAVRGVDLPTLAYAWLLADPRVTAVVVGPRRPDQLRPALEALELDLSPPEREQLTALFA